MAGLLRLGLVVLLAGGAVALVSRSSPAPSTVAPAPAPSPASAEPVVPEMTATQTRARGALLDAARFPLSGFVQSDDKPSSYRGVPAWTRSFSHNERPAARVQMNLLYVERERAGELYRQLVDGHDSKPVAGYDIALGANAFVYEQTTQASTAGVIVHLPEGLLWVIGSYSGATPEQALLFTRQVAELQATIALAR